MLRFQYVILWSSGPPSRYAQVRELRTQSGGRPLRTFYAFNPLRTAILLIGGDKTGDDRWYETFVPTADRLFDAHLRELTKEGKHSPANAAAVYAAIAGFGAPLQGIRPKTSPPATTTSAPDATRKDSISSQTFRGSISMRLGSGALKP